MAPDLIQMSWSHFFPSLLLLFKIPWPLRSFLPAQTLRSRSLTTVTMASTLQCYWLEWASCFPITVSSPTWTTCTRSLKVWTCINNAMHVLMLASPTCRVHFHIKHPWFMALVFVSGTSIVFDMSLTYILVALLAVILNNVLVERLSMHTRITVGKLQRQSFHFEKLLITGTSAFTHLLMSLWEPQGLSG